MQFLLGFSLSVTAAAVCLNEIWRDAVSPDSVSCTPPVSVFLDDFLATGKEGDQDPQLEFEQLAFSHPLFIMFSSGTTGAPKCMVHSAGVSVCAHRSLI